MPQYPFVTSTFDDIKIMKITMLPSQCERARRLGPFVLNYTAKVTIFYWLWSLMSSSMSVVQLHFQRWKLPLLARLFLSRKISHQFWSKTIYNLNLGLRLRLSKENRQWYKNLRNPNGDIKGAIMTAKMPFCHGVFRGTYVYGQTVVSRTSML